MQGAASSNLAAPTIPQAQSVNSFSPQRVNKPPISTPVALDYFIHSSAHKSPKTVQTLRERLIPFVDYLASRGVTNPLDITCEHIDGFLHVIGQGRRGKPLSPTSGLSLVI